MSMFALPTTSSPSDTGVSSVRVDEFAPVSTVNPDGGGTVAFECTSPANSFWCPRLSHFNFRLKVVTRNSDGTTGALTSIDAGTGGGSMGGGNVQFRSYPAAACGQSFSHSINGVTVETVSDVQETAAFLNRTGMMRGRRATRYIAWRARTANAIRGRCPRAVLYNRGMVQVTPEPSFAVPCSRHRVSSACRGVYLVDVTGSY